MIRGIARRSDRWSPALAAGAVLWLAACAGGVGSPPDGGTPDAGLTDAGLDAGNPDAGQVDAGPRDAGSDDAGPGDAGLADAGPPDAGPRDAGSAAVPAPAAAAGYILQTFGAAFSSATVDLANSGASGFAWYPWNIFGEHTNTAAIHLNANGSVTLAGDTTGPGGELATITPTNGGAKFVGTAFGGGAYFDAVLEFDPQTVVDAGFKGWPAWWALAIDSLIGLPTEFWAGTDPDAGYEHNVEADFFEYDASGQVLAGHPNNYGSTLHDWYGVYDKTCPPGFCVANAASGLRTVDAGTDFTQPHAYGCLWVPATATRMGSASFYFDEQPVGSVYQWQQYADEPPPPTPTSPWLFSWMDVAHYYLILGTGVGEPMTVRSVAVWQATDANNLKN